MKIKLSVSEESYDKIERLFIEKGFEIDDNSEFELIEHNRYIEYLSVKDNSTGERLRISTDEVISVESYGHVVEVYTLQSVYTTGDRLYQLAELLDPERFIRVNKSVIVAKNKIKKIKPALSMKFIIIMNNDRRIDVTRSYYYSFKQAFNI